MIFSTPPPNWKSKNFENQHFGKKDWPQIRKEKTQKLMTKLKCYSKQTISSVLLIAPRVTNEGALVYWDCSWSVAFLSIPPHFHKTRPLSYFQNWLSCPYPLFPLPWAPLATFPPLHLFQVGPSCFLGLSLMSHHFSPPPRADSEVLPWWSSACAWKHEIAVRSDMKRRGAKKISTEMPEGGKSRWLVSNTASLKRKLLDKSQERSSQGGISNGRLQG